VDAGEAVSEHAAAQVCLELARDEPGDGALSLASSGKEGLELSPHGLVQDALFGPAPLVAMRSAVRRGVARPARCTRLWWIVEAHRVQGVRAACPDRPVTARLRRRQLPSRGAELAQGRAALCPLL
jgi:hypothetical protein